eukprot:1159596-Pelagomonas_calceolata.AAC.3
MQAGHEWSARMELCRARSCRFLLMSLEGGPGGVKGAILMASCGKPQSVYQCMSVRADGRESIIIGGGANLQTLLAAGMNNSV